MAHVFKDEWLKMFDWISAVENDKYTAYCKVCRRKVTIRYNGIHSLYTHQEARKHQKNLNRKVPTKKEKKLKSSLSSSMIPPYPNNHPIDMPKVYESPYHLLLMNYLGDSSRTAENNVESVAPEVRNKNSDIDNSQIYPHQEAKSKELTIFDACSLNSPCKKQTEHATDKLVRGPFHWNVDDNTSKALCLPSEAECLSVCQKQPEHRYQRNTQNGSQTLSDEILISSSCEIVPFQVNSEFSEVKDLEESLPPVPSHAFLKVSSVITEELHQKDVQKNAEEDRNQMSNQDKSPSHKDDTDDADYYQHLSTLDHCFFTSTYSQLKAAKVKKLIVQGNVNTNKHLLEAKQNNVVIEHQHFPEPSLESALTSGQNYPEAEVYSGTSCSMEKSNRNIFTESLQNSSGHSYHSAPPEINLRYIENKSFTPSSAATQPYQSENSHTCTNTASRAPYHRLSGLLENIFESNDRESAVPCSSNNYSKGANGGYSGNQLPATFPDTVSSLLPNDNSFKHKFVSQIDFKRRIKYFKDTLLEAKLNFDRECTNILQQLENFISETISLKLHESEDLNFIDSIYDRYLSNRSGMERDLVKSIMLLSNDNAKSFNSSKKCSLVENYLHDERQHCNECQSEVSGCEPTLTSTNYIDTSPKYPATIKECKKETKRYKRPNVKSDIGKTIKSKRKRSN